MGDLDAPEVDALVLRYLGTIAPRPPAAPPAARPIELMAPFGAKRQQTWHLQARRTAPCHGSGSVLQREEVAMGADRLCACKGMHK